MWLVALTLIASSLTSGLSLKFSSDPAAFAVALVVYTGHSIIFGFLYSLLPDIAILVTDMSLLLRRSVPWRKTAILFEDLRYDELREVISSLGVVCAAALAAPHFGQPSLNKTGLIGVVVILAGEVFRVPRLFSRDRWPLLELKATAESKSVARLYLSGRFFKQVSLRRSFASAVAQLLSADWEVATDLNGNPSGSTWLRKNIAERRLRFMGEIARHRMSRDDLASEFRYAVRYLAPRGCGRTCRRDWLRVCVVLAASTRDGGPGHRSQRFPYT